MARKTSKKWLLKKIAKNKKDGPRQAKKGYKVKRYTKKPSRGRRV